MHEMSLIRPAVDLVLQECAGKNVAEVRAVHLTVGVMRDVIEDYMEGLFRYLARGTVAEHAKLVITRAPLVVICNECGTPFPVVRDVIEDYMEGLFRYLARGTVAEHAKLVITRAPLVVICNECGTPFPVDTRDEATQVCPHCHARKNYRFYSGNEFRVDRIEVEVSAEAVPA